MRPPLVERFLHSRWRNVILTLVFGGMLYLIIALIQKRTQNESIICGDLIFCLIGFFLWMLFFSQFVVPLRTLGDRLNIFGRLLLYTFQLHGPAVYIENGKIRQREEEMLRRGPGIIVLDSASAALLRTDVRVTRAVGPGVAFLEWQERIDGAVDLHYQKQFIGPWESDDVFSPQKPGEADKAFSERSKRRQMTSGLTRDHIEVVPNIWVKFKINANPGEGLTKFGFRAESVELAVLSRNIDLNEAADSPNRLTNWNWVPAHLAVDIWRELLAKFTLNELFSPHPWGRNGITVIAAIMRERLTQPNARVLDSFGQPILDQNGNPVTAPSLEYQVLQRRGIKVYLSAIFTPRMQEDIEASLVNNWATSWLDRATAERELITQQRATKAQEGRMEAAENYAEAIAKTISDACNSGLITPSANQLLDQLVTGNLSLFERFPQLKARFQDLQENLEQLREQLRRTA
jgi:hypothetical protein